MTKNITHITFAGIGSTSPGSMTLDALNSARVADVLLVPRSIPDLPGLAETVILHHFPDKVPMPIVFPMTHDTIKRTSLIHSQLLSLRNRLEGKNIFFPVIGDSMLYSTGYYLVEEMRKVFADVETAFIPGISAHSLAASCAKRFLAVADEILTIIPGTASPERIASALTVSDAVAIYKPSAIRDIASLVDPGIWRDIIRVEHAGSPSRERIIYGPDALHDVSEYMSVILLHR